MRWALSLKLPADHYIMELQFLHVVFCFALSSGALRPVAQSENRLKEAQKLGFSKAIIPTAEQRLSKEYLELTQFTDLSSFVGDIFGAG